MKVIIGAGPAGLYTAIKLKQENVEDVVVYDSRANHYNRPGHLNDNVFLQAEQGLNFKFWKGGSGHIKELERHLYAKAVELGVKFENKQFVRLHQDAKLPGVVVTHEGQEEIIPADYVFDCTGAKRAVIAAVNQLSPESPLKLTAITEPPVQHHFLAYVKMKPGDWQRFSDAEYLSEMGLDFLEAPQFAHSMIKLRELGWKELRVPYCYGKHFGKDKVCLYMHAPDNLDPNNHDLWVQAVLEAYASSISYQHLPASNKPRFMPFTMKAEALRQVSYKGKGLPTVIALGDAQIDFDYRLAHGIFDGMKRIDALFKHMEIIDGKIYYFDAEEYYRALSGLLKEHKGAVINAAEHVKSDFAKALDSGRHKLIEAKLRSSDVNERVAIDRMLNEIQLRQNFSKGREVFAQLHDTNMKLKLNDANMDRMATLHSNLLSGLQLPELFVKEREKAQELCLHLASSWKELGNALFKKDQFNDAIAAYKKALEIYSLETYAGQHTLNEIALYSNLAIIYTRVARYSDAITVAKTALLLCKQQGDVPTVLATRTKIVFNLIKALNGQARERLQAQKTQDANALHMEAKSLLSEYTKIFGGVYLKELEAMLKQLEALLPQNPSHVDEELSGIELVDTPRAEEPAPRAEPVKDAQVLQRVGLFSEAKQDDRVGCIPGRCVIS